VNSVARHSSVLRSSGRKQRGQNVAIKTRGEMKKKRGKSSGSAGLTTPAKSDKKEGENARFESTSLGIKEKREREGGKGGGILGGSPKQKKEERGGWRVRCSRTQKKWCFPRCKYIKKDGLGGKRPLKGGRKGGQEKG